MLIFVNIEVNYWTWILSKYGKKSAFELSDFFTKL